MTESSIRPAVPQRIARGAADYPSVLHSRLGENAPVELTVLGDPGLLRSRRTALFCSASTPGDAILRTHDAARRMRDEGVTIISGFHSPIEKECLRILLRGKQPIIVCPARAIDAMRIPTETRVAFDAGRVLFLSPLWRTTRTSHMSYRTAGLPGSRECSKGGAFRGWMKAERKRLLPRSQ